MHCLGLLGGKFFIDNTSEILKCCYLLKKVGQFTIIRKKG